MDDWLWTMMHSLFFIDTVIVTVIVQKKSLEFSFVIEFNITGK